MTNKKLENLLALATGALALLSYIIAIFTGGKNQ
jgi:hypothetical protein